MRVLVTGATGLIGAALVAALIDAGHSVVAIARRTARAERSVPAADWIALDIAAAIRPEDWLPHLAEIDAVVNCAGVLQDSPHDSTHGVHVDGADALFTACEQRGLRRVVQISAIGLDRLATTAFARTKQVADESLKRRDLNWVILRPSVVLGPAAYGGSALFRGLAALPVLPVIPGTGPLQVVQLDDVVATCLFFITPSAPSQIVLDLPGPERLSFADVIRQYRSWLGWREPYVVKLPYWAFAALCRVADSVSWLGWRPPLRTTSLHELSKGSVGDPRAWTEMTGIVPQSLTAALAKRPASVQERRFAGMYLLKPVAFAVLALFWIVTGVVSLGPGCGSAIDLMREAGAGIFSVPAVIAGSVIDIAIGAAIAWRRTARKGLWAALAVTSLYLVVGTLTTPRLWGDPLGPFVKIFPILVLNLVALAVLEDR